MTGFANHTCEFPGGSATLEVRSVNNRGLDLKLRVPDLFAALEPKLRETITKVAKRGSLQVNIRYSLQDDISEVPAINEKMIDQVLFGIEQIEDLALARHLSLAPSKASDILAIKGVMAHETGVAELLPEMSQTVQTAMSQMIVNWDMDRAREGEALARILGDQIDTIADLVSAARALLPER
ncbi:MAG: YicC family protein, partial [Rhodobacteraceae bacterium]|nr:YicC family protein [Paracoccaceae bacterium]